MNYFITGIGTNIGKTIVAAILTEALEADYWKPIQAGDLDNSDSLKIKNLISNTKTQIHKEAYKLKHALSPHATAKLENIIIDLNKITLPKTTNNIIIEGAGGLMVPLNNKELIIDLIAKLGAEVILVSQNYLGSINHTLLTVQALFKNNIPVKGIIFNGIKNESTEDFILEYTKLNFIGRVEETPNITKEWIRQQACKFINI
jgi:dethiobiotin synthetase